MVLLHLWMNLAEIILWSKLMKTRMRHLLMELHQLIFFRCIRFKDEKSGIKHLRGWGFIIWKETLLRVIFLLRGRVRFSFSNWVCRRWKSKIAVLLKDWVLPIAWGLKYAQLWGTSQSLGWCKWLVLGLRSMKFWKKTLKKRRIGEKEFLYFWELNLFFLIFFSLLLNFIMQGCWWKGCSCINHHRCVLSYLSIIENALILIWNDRTVLHITLLDQIFFRNVVAHLAFSLR